MKLRKDTMVNGVRAVQAADCLIEFNHKWKHKYGKPSIDDFADVIRAMLHYCDREEITFSDIWKIADLRFQQDIEYERKFEKWQNRKR